MSTTQGDISKKPRPFHSNLQIGEIPGPVGLPGLAKTYKVQSGDTLTSVAMSQYGDKNQWPKIFGANRALLGVNRMRLTPGQTLIIP